MEDGFEEHLAGLMDYRTEPSAPVSVAGVRAGARRRSRMRTIGTAGSALAVAAVGIGVATLNGSGGHGAAPGPGLSAGMGGGVTPPGVSSPPVTSGSPGTSTGTGTGASPTAPQPGTSVRVSAGTTIPVAEGFSVRVTDTALCYTATPAFTHAPGATSDATSCMDTTDPNIRRRPQDPANLSMNFFARGGGVLAVFQGPEIPVRAEIVMRGTHYPVTLVSTPGMKGWIALYALIPPEPPNMMGAPALVAYDASGKVLAQHKDDEFPIHPSSGGTK